jgi:hypothetical protein
VAAWQCIVQHIFRIYCEIVLSTDSFKLHFVVLVWYKISSKSSTQKLLIQMKPNLIGIVFGMSSFKILSYSPVLYPRWSLLLRKEISLMKTFVAVLFQVKMNSNFICAAMTSLLYLPGFPVYILSWDDLWFVHYQNCVWHPSPPSKILCVTPQSSIQDIVCDTPVLHPRLPIIRKSKQSCKF